MKKILGYSLLALLAYAVFLIVELPAQVVWRFVEPKLALNRSPIQVTSLSGTLWDGRGDLLVQALPRKSASPAVGAHLEWQFRPWRFVWGDELLQVRVRQEESQLNASVKCDWGGLVETHLEGAVALSHFNPLVRRDRITLDGSVQAQDLMVRFDGQQRKVVAAGGQLSWSGGTIGYPIGTEVRQQPMPPLLGLLGLRGDEVVLDIKDNPASLGAAEATLKPSGVIEIAVRRKLLDLAGAPWASNSTPQDVVFRIRQKLY